MAIDRKTATKKDDNEKIGESIASMLPFDKAEECSIRVIRSIEGCVSAIRSIQEFAPPTNNTRRSSNNNKKSNRPSLAGTTTLLPQLYHRLEELGTVRDVNETVQVVEAKLGRTSRTDHNTKANGTLTSDDDDQRRLVVRRILLPLIDSLTWCYEVLDKLPQQPQTQHEPQEKGEKVIHRGRRRKGNAPKPPRGMLSIQNYTDIAVLLEFTVCTSILPNLQPNVLTPVEDRVRYLLPKSLAGRIPRQSLLWGTQQEQQYDYERQRNATDVVASSPSQAVALELQTTADCVSRLVLLDRFRPLLLPRHLTDIYAAFFQYEHYRSGSSSSMPSLDEQCLRRGRVDAYSQAKALQSLLLKGKAAPAWLRQRVSGLFAGLATVELRAIVHVFVRNASSSSFDERTAAALRLGRALTTTTTTISTNKQKHEYLSKLCLQMVKLLDTDGVSADEESCSVLTVWAVLNQLSTRQIRTHFLSLLVDGMLPKTKESLAGFAVHQTISSRGRSCFDETRIVERDAGSAGTVVVTNRWQKRQP